MLEQNVIDFEALKKKEAAKYNKTYQFSQIPRETLYNLTQDLRHLVMIDVRPKEEYDKNHIRDSFLLTDFENKKDLLKSFEEVDRKYEIQEEKYSTKKIRRIVIIDFKTNKFDENDPKHKLIIDAVKENRDFDKVHYLQGGIEDFSAKYPFLCLDFKERDASAKTEIKPGMEIEPDTIDDNTNKEEAKQPENSNLASFNQYERKLIYSFCRFPTEIVNDVIYLGSIHNSNNRKQLSDLKIKSIIDLTTYEGDKKPKAFKETNFVYRNIPLNGEIIPLLDFDEICQWIDALRKTEKTPLLIYDDDGDTYAPGLAIAYLMWSKKLKVDMASMIVFQKKGTVNINKLLYSLLQVYSPGQSGIKKN